MRGIHLKVAASIGLGVAVAAFFGCEAHDRSETFPSDESSVTAPPATEPDTTYGETGAAGKDSSKDDSASSVDRPKINVDVGNGVDVQVGDGVNVDVDESGVDVDVDPGSNETTENKNESTAKP